MRNDSTGPSHARGAPIRAEVHRLVNLTPHRVVLETLAANGDTQRLVLPPADAVPRLVIAAGNNDVLLIRGGDDHFDGSVLPVVNGTRAIGIEPPLPDPQPGVLYITSRALAEYIPERMDLVWPEDQIRDREGTVIGARKLGRVGKRDSDVVNRKGQSQQDRPYKHEVIVTSSAATVRQGPGFISIRDSSRMRMSLILEMKSTRTWDDSFPLHSEGNTQSYEGNTAPCWKNGGVNFRTPRSSSYPGKDQSELHPHVAESILSHAIRRSLRLTQVWKHRSKDGSVAFSIGALEVLKVKETPGDLRVLLVIHAEVPCDDYSTVREAIHTRRTFHRLRDTLLQILTDEGGCEQGSLSFPGRTKSDESAPPITTITWVPQAIVSSWRSVSTVEQAHALGVEVSSDVVDTLMTENAYHGGSNVAGNTCDTAVIIAGWQWGFMPATDGIELGDTRFADALRSLHCLSQSWAVYATEHGIAYVETQHTDYSVEAIRRMLTRHLNIHLLIALNQMRTLDLSRRLAALARDLRSATNKLSASDAPTDETQLDELIERAVVLDAEATAFLASEWWTDVSSRSKADQILVWMQEATDLDRSVNQVVQQARAIRESIQTLIERREHAIALEQQQAEREQHYTSQMMEWAIGILTFIGIPLTVLLEVWINWDPTISLTARSGPHWLIWLVLVIGGAIIVGVLLARLFNVDLVPPIPSDYVKKRRQQAKDERRLTKRQRGRAKRPQRR